MENNADTFFPKIEPVVQEHIVDVDLTPYGLPAIKLRRRSNFSDFTASADDKMDVIAKGISKMRGVYVSELTLRFADQIARMWVSPQMEGGRNPNRDDLIALSIANADAFGAIVSELNKNPNLQDKPDELADGALRDFTGGAADTPA